MIHIYTPRLLILHFTPVFSLFKTLFVIIFLMTSSVNARDIYVATTGSDSGSGTLSDPYRTIQKAATEAVSGDIVYIGGGTYRETVVPPNSGQSGQPIVFRPYQNETVIVSGLETVSSLTNNDWQQDSGEIYYIDGISEWTTSTINQSDQVFVNGEMMLDSVFPNNPTRTLGDYPYALATSHTGAPNGRTHNALTLTLHGADFNGGANDFFKDAEIIFSPPPFWYAKSGVVTSSSAGSITIHYQAQWEDNWFHSTYDAGQIPVLLKGFRNGLDAEGEYFLDTQNDRLYLWVPGGGSPSTKLVEVKRRDYAFDLSERSYIEIHGLHIIGATITTDNVISTGYGESEDAFRSNNANSYSGGPIASANNITLNSINARYVFHADDLTAGGYFQYQTGSGIILSGSDHKLTNSVVMYSSQNGVTTIGRRNMIDNNYIGYSSYYTQETANISFGYQKTLSEDMIVTNNTIEYSGRSLLGMRNATSSSENATKIQNNIFRYGCLRTEDGGALYTWNNTAVNGVEISHNLIYENYRTKDIFGIYGANGIYLDGDYNEDFYIHHNILYDHASAIILNGTSNKIEIHNNTFKDSDAGHIASGKWKDRSDTDIVHNIFRDPLTWWQPGRTEIWFGGGAAPYEFGNIFDDTDPLFTDEANGDFTIGSNSPAATATTTSSNITYDAGYVGALAPNAVMFSVGTNVDPNNFTFDINIPPSLVITSPTIASLGVPGTAYELVIEGTVTDDGEPQGSSVSTLWQKVSGPGTVTFSSANTVSTRAQFSAEGDYEIRIDATDSQDTTSRTYAITVDNNPDLNPVASSPVPGSGLQQHNWDGLSYNNLSDFMASNAYPDNYSSTEPYTSAMDFGGQFDASNKYARVWTGYFIPPQSGNYTFQLLTDDQGQVYISSDADPANRVLAVSSAGPTAYNRWNFAQTSNPISLQVDIPYYIEILFYENTGYEYIRMGMTLPDGSIEQPVTSQHFAQPLNAIPSVANFGPIPDAGADQNVSTNSTVSLSGSAQNDTRPEGAALSYEWGIQSGPSIPTITGLSNQNASFQTNIAGTYIVEFIASDTEVKIADTIEIEVTGNSSGWAAWASNNSLDSAMPDMDSDADGISNFLEYALDSDPHLNTPNVLPKMTRNSSDLGFSFNRAQASVTYRVETSSDLVNWTTEATNPGNHGETVTVTIANASNPIFVRLVVEE